MSINKSEWETVDTTNQFAGVATQSTPMPFRIKGALQALDGNQKRWSNRVRNNKQTKLFAARRSILAIPEKPAKKMNIQHNSTICEGGKDVQKSTVPGLSPIYSPAQTVAPLTMSTLWEKSRITESSSRKVKRWILSTEKHACENSFEPIVEASFDDVEACEKSKIKRNPSVEHRKSRLSCTKTSLLSCNQPSFVNSLKEQSANEKLAQSCNYTSDKSVSYPKEKQSVTCDKVPCEETTNKSISCPSDKISCKEKKNISNCAKAPVKSNKTSISCSIVVNKKEESSNSKYVPSPIPSEFNNFEHENTVETDIATELRKAKTTQKRKKRRQKMTMPKSPVKVKKINSNTKLNPYLKGRPLNGAMALQTKQADRSFEACSGVQRMKYVYEVFKGTKPVRKCIHKRYHLRGQPDEETEVVNSVEEKQSTTHENEDVTPPSNIECTSRLSTAGKRKLSFYERPLTECESSQTIETNDLPCSADHLHLLETNELVKTKRLKRSSPSFRGPSCLKDINSFD